MVLQMTKKQGILRFIQLMPRTPPATRFILKDLPGSGRRIDILCRDLAACFDWAPTIWPRERIELVAILGDTKALHFTAPPDSPPIGEVAWAKAIKDSLDGRPPPFVSVENASVRDVVAQIRRHGGHLWVLDEGGRDLTEIDSGIHKAENSFMLGDHMGFDSQARRVIGEMHIPAISLGPRSYLSSHCIAMVISHFERMTHNARRGVV